MRQLLELHCFTELPGENFNDGEEGVLFPYPEERCFKTCSHFSYLQAYRNTGRHKITLYDKATRLYACKLMEGNERIPTLQSNVQTGDG